jgi:hypothetical protein
MSTPEHKLHVTNDLPAVITLWLEPWGEDYIMLPDETFEVVAKGTAAEFYFHVIYNAADIKVYAEGSCDAISMFQDGRQLECGHNRALRS